MLKNLKRKKFDILIFFLENKTFFLSSKNFKLSVFLESFKKVLNYYFLKDVKSSIWICILKESKFLYITNFFVKLIFFKFLYYYCEFLKFNIFLTIGLGFRKKNMKRVKAMFLNVGSGKWALVHNRPGYFFNNKRRSIYFLTDSKELLKQNLNGIRYLRKEVQYKTKGVMVFNRLWVKRHVPRSILFARRIKFYGIKIKLTKKQKQRK